MQQVNSSRSKILFAATEMFFRLGIKSVSMDDLAREIGMSKKTLYAEFDSKEDILEEVIKHLHDMDVEFCNMTCAGSHNAIEEMMQISSYVLRQLRMISPSTLHDLRKYYPAQWKRIQSFHEDYIYGVIQANLRKGIEEGLYRDTIDIKIVSKFYVHKSWLIVDETIFSLRDYRRDQLFHEYMMYHMNGITSPKGKKYLKKFQEQFDA